MERALCPILVGRERELGLLEDALLASNRSAGHFIVLSGEAGVGKTRLANELQDRARKAGIVVMSGTCSEAEFTLPYLPFLEAIGNYLAGADVDQIKLRLGPATCRQLGQLFPQLELQTTLLNGGDPVQAKLRLFEALLALFRIPSDRHGLLLVLEDLHWADASTRELLEYLARRVRRARILVLCSYRSDELSRRHPLLPLVQRWQRAGTAQTIRLEPLPPDAVGNMATAIFEGQPVEPELRDFLHARSEGNPFVLEEILKAALDQGQIFRTAKGWDRKAIRELHVPPTVKDSIMLRVERLSDEQADILRVAAVLGGVFDYGTLVAASGHSEAVVQAALRSFVEQQLMDEEGSSRYHFRHTLTREAVYDDLIAPERERLHLCAAEVLRSRPDTSTIDLASHLLAAGRWEEAIPTALQAASEAEARKGYAEAAQLFERVVDHVSDRCQRADLLSRLGRAHFFAGETRRGQRYLEEGVGLLDQCRKSREAAAYRVWLGRCYWLRSRPDLARREYEAARGALEPYGPSEDLAHAYVRLAGLHNFEKEHEKSLALALEAVRIAEAAGADAPRIWAYNFIGDNLQALGRVDEGLAWLDRSYRDALERGDDWIATNALYNAVVDQLHHCRVREALERFSWLQSLYQRSGMRDAGVLQLEGFLAMRAHGEPERARRLLEAALARAEEVEESLFAHRMRLDLAHAYGSLGKLEEAWRVFPGQPATPETQEVMGFLYESIWLHLAGGNLEAARRAAEQASQMIDEDPGRNSEIYLLERSVDAFVSGGHTMAARRMLEKAAIDSFERHPLLDRAWGRILLDEGDTAQACEKLRRAARVLQDAGYADEEWPARRTLAQALLAIGDRGGAEVELRAVMAAATERGHVFEATAAHRRLLEVGVEAPQPEFAWSAGRDDEALAQQRLAEFRQPTERLVTVMFVDVRGYTTMSVKEPRPRLADRVATFHRWAQREIQRHDGLVDRYAGDAVMAAFNVTGMRLDHSLLALQAAFAIRDKAAFTGLPVGIGIAVGPAVVGQFSEGASVTAVGETTNLAARLQAHARAGEVLLSEEAYRRARDWLAEQGLAAAEESLALKGFPQPVSAYRLSAHVPEAT